MNHTPQPLPPSAFSIIDDGTFLSTDLTRGPWHPDHQHAGPPIALVSREIERAANQNGLTHLSRLTANLLRPVPIGELNVKVAADYVGRNAGHFSARLLAGDKEIALFTALARRESEVRLPDNLSAHAAPAAAKSPDDSPIADIPFARHHVGYFDLMETRAARGKMFRGPSAIWFRLRYPLVEGETPSPYQRVAVAADSGNGISAVLDIAHYSFVNSDLTINLFRRPQGEWICVDAQTFLGPNGSGLAEAMLFDAYGLVGRSTQNLAISARS